MSGWFDSSLTFAKSAFSQAQKSIDKVLDIDESQKLGENGKLLGILESISQAGKIKDL